MSLSCGKAAHYNPKSRHAPINSFRGKPCKLCTHTTAITSHTTQPPSWHTHTPQPIGLGCGTPQPIGLGCGIVFHNTQNKTRSNLTHWKTPPNNAATDQRYHSCGGSKRFKKSMPYRAKIGCGSKNDRWGLSPLAATTPSVATISSVHEIGCGAHSVCLVEAEKCPGAFDFWRGNRVQ